jgi:beta-glucosidase
MNANEFGPDFLWGVSTAAAQIEGAWNVDGRGPSIWDEFAKKIYKIKNKANPYVACNFYENYKQDLVISKYLGFKYFRFSISWSRIFPEGIGKINLLGVKFYHDIIDECLRLDMMPLITLYHWDLPQELEKKGGWTSTYFHLWFSEYVTFCAKEYGDRVKHWIVLNEPLGFTALGYGLGIHAPGIHGIENFSLSVKNALYAQVIGGQLLKKHVKGGFIGTTFSCSKVIPFRHNTKDKKAAQLADLFLNRLFIEPLIGKGIPYIENSFIDRMHVLIKSWNHKNDFVFDFDFWGIQNYFPMRVKHNIFMPYLQASRISPSEINVLHTDSDWEVNPETFYDIIKTFANYDKSKSLIITENGANYKDEIIDGEINDPKRINYFETHLGSLKKAMSEGIKIDGYFAWTLTDNFEWADGYSPKFGLVHIDFKTQKRTIKQSGIWWKSFLKSYHNLQNQHDTEFLLKNKATF